MFESKFEPLPVIWQSLQEAIPQDNRRFWLQNQWPSSSAAQLGRVGRASTNAGCFQVCCRLRQSLLAATCSLKENDYHSCDTGMIKVFPPAKVHFSLKSDLFSPNPGPLHVPIVWCHTCSEPIGICNSNAWSVSVPESINECVLCLSACKMHCLA